MKNYKKRIAIISSVILLLVVGSYLYAKNSQFNKSTNQGLMKNINKGNCLSDECLIVGGLEYPVATTSDTVKDALIDAINDEYVAYSTYEKVITKLGMVRPFSMIIRAEENHISQLKSLFDKYGLEIPQNTFADKIIDPSNLQQACQTGVDAEIANAKLYKEKLLPQVKDYEDIKIVFTNLMNASEQKHLVAFERCN